ncbi:MAG TPA: ATP-binding protein [Galbitalea sp.]
MRPDLAAVTTLAARSPRPVVLIDGRSGSGKTELATALAPVIGAQLVRLDDVYPGWDGLEAASEAVVRDILGRHRWQRWDWAAMAPAEWNELDRAAPVIIEGCGALSRTSMALATLAIWVELDAATRKTRALARDGDAYAPHWDRWAAQEASFIAREHPADLADLILQG